MKTTHKFLLGLAATSALLAYGIDVARAQNVSTKEKTVTQSSYSVGTRRVGMVGNRAYPLIVSQVDSRTVQTSHHKGVKTSSDVTTTTYMYQDEPYMPATPGATYYTSIGNGDYRDGELDVHVVSTGSFNN